MATVSRPRPPREFPSTKVTKISLHVADLSHLTCGSEPSLEASKMPPIDRNVGSTFSREEPSAPPPLHFGPPGGPSLEVAPPVGNSAPPLYLLTVASLIDQIKEVSNLKVEGIRPVQ